MKGPKGSGRIEIRLLGRFEVTLDGCAAEGPWQRRRAGDLVKVLVLAPKRRRHREQVVDMLWPHLASEAGFANLHKAACLARKALGTDAIVLEGGWVELWPNVAVITD